MVSLNGLRSAAGDSMSRGRAVDTEKSNNRLEVHELITSGLSRLIQYSATFDWKGTVV